MPWHHWMPKIESPGILDARKILLNRNPEHGSTLISNTHTHTHTRTHTHTQPFYGSMDFARDNPGELVPEETFTHSHLSWSSIVPYLLHPSTTIHGIQASSLFNPFNPCAWQSFSQSLSISNIIKNIPVVVLTSLGSLCMLTVFSVARQCLWFLVISFNLQSSLHLMLVELFRASSFMTLMTKPHNKASSFLHTDFYQTVA